MKTDQAEQFQEPIQSLVAFLVRLSDAEYQQREWLKTSNTSVCQLDTIEDCFEQFSEAYWKICNTGSMSKCLGDANAVLLEKLFDALHGYAWDRSNCVPECCLDFGNVQEVLVDPKWHEIQRLAKELYDALNNSQVVSH